MSHAEARCLFTSLLGELICWASVQGIKLALSEAYVGDTDAADGDYDGPHKKGGAHYLGTAADLNMYRKNKDGGLDWISDGGDPTWTMLGAHWESMHSLCFWGGRIQDANHFSIRFQGRA